MKREKLSAAAAVPTHLLSFFAFPLYLQFYAASEHRREGFRRLAVFGRGAAGDAWQQGQSFRPREGLDGAALT